MFSTFFVTKITISFFLADTVITSFQSLFKHTNDLELTK